MEISEKIDAIYQKVCCENWELLFDSKKQKLPPLKEEQLKETIKHYGKDWFIHLDLVNQGYCPALVTKTLKEYVANGVLETTFGEKKAKNNRGYVTKLYRIRG